MTPRRVLLAFALTMLALWMPAVFRVPAPVAPDAPSMAGVVNLIGANADSAHGCAITPTLIVTNAHVTGKEGENSYRFSTSEGQEGVAAPIMVSRNADLAGLTPVGAPIKVLARVAANAPAIGSEVFWVGYDWHTRKTLFERTHYHGKVLRVVAGIIVIDAATDAGTSGGCVVNGAGEVVGVIAWGIDGNDDKQEATLAVSIYGEWMPKQPKGGK